MSWSMDAVSVPPECTITGAFLLQEKYDGVRINSSGLLRSGRVVPNYELRDKLKELPPGIDGELINEQMTTAQISAVVNSPRAFATGIRFIAFDMTTRAVIAENRQTELRKQVQETNFVKIAPTTVVNLAKANYGRVISLLPKAVEGVILRKPDGLYQIGKCSHIRSPIVKYKRKEEFVGEVIDVVCGTGERRWMQALVVKVAGFDICAAIGTGFSDTDRSPMNWELGEIVSFYARYSAGEWREVAFRCKMREDRNDK